jgi:hypothetical protein
VYRELEKRWWCNFDARFTSKADIEATQTDVCFVPKADIREVTLTQAERSPRGGHGQVF